MGLSENEVYHPQVAILIGRVLIDHQWIQGYPTCSNTHEFTNNHTINVWWCLVLCLCECRTWWIHDEYMMNHDYTILNSGNMQTNPCWQESWVLWRMFLTALGYVLCFGRGIGAADLAMASIMVMIWCDVANQNMVGWYELYWMKLMKLYLFRVWPICVVLDVKSFKPTSIYSSI